MSQSFHRIVSIVCAFTLAASLVPSVALADASEGVGGDSGAMAAAFSGELSPSLEGLDPASAVVSELFEDTTMDDGGGISLFSEEASLVPLKEGNYERWIDRIDPQGVPIERAYARLEEACDNDGVEDYLIEDEYFNGEAAQGGWFVPGKDSQGNVIPALVLFDATPTETISEETLKELLQVYTLAVVSAFDRDHPEVFWMLSGFRTVSFTGTSNGTKHLYYAIVLDSDRRSPLYPDEAAIKEGIESRDGFIASIMEGAPSTDDPEGRVRYFNNWLTKHNEYNTTDDLSALLENKTYNDAWECISALEGREGTRGPVCEAYSRAFKVLCDESDIPCVLVSGVACGPDGPLGGHMWNYVELGGEWYGADVTWNDPATGRESDDWLLVGADTPFYGTMSFITTHPVLNAFFSGYLFPNGPELSAQAYVRDCSKMGHVFGDATILNVKAPACEVDGSHDEKRVCKYCAHEEIKGVVEAGTATGHEMGAWATGTAATCEATGTEVRSCTHTGCTRIETRDVAALGHDWSAWTTAKDATCTESGTEQRRCTRAGCTHAETREVAALGHKVQSGNVEGATCTQDGTVSGVCSVCKAVVDKQVIPGSALGHDWAAWEVATPATCTASGVERRRCTREGCSQIETRAIKATDHAPGAWTTTRAATCTVPGAEERRCSHAGCSFVETRAIPAAGHAFGAYRANGDAKVNADGTETATCAKCGTRTTRTAAGSALTPAVGQAVTVGGVAYTATGAATVTYTGPASKTTTSATVPATVTISGRAYQVTAIAPGAFAGNKKLKSVKIGANVTAIPASAFKGCTALASVSFGANVKTIGSRAFFGCKALKSVTLGAKVASIGAGAFQNCSKLTKVTVKSKSLRSIGKSVFAGCRALKSVTLSSTKLTTIGASAFSGCKKLKTLALKTTKLKSVGKSALKGTAKKLVVKVPKSKVKAYQKLFKNKGLKTVRVKR